ncbi:molybdopterin oxidoreductase [Deinococcus yavapaiensis]|nr:molybdopterin oxidoreductase [Deinococcus yavapaiensis]
MHVGNYLGLVHGSEERLVDVLRKVARHHRDEPDVEQTCLLLAAWSEKHLKFLRPLVEKYGEEKNPEPDDLEVALFHGPRTGSLGLLRDLHDLWLMSNEVQLCWTVLEQAAQALRDDDLERVCKECGKETKRQTAFFLTRIKQAAPQALVVA